MCRMSLLSGVGIMTCNALAHLNPVSYFHFVFFSVCVVRAGLFLPWMRDTFPLSWPPVTLVLVSMGPLLMRCFTVFYHLADRNVRWCWWYCVVLAVPGVSSGDELSTGTTLIAVAAVAFAFVLAGLFTRFAVVHKRLNSLQRLDHLPGGYDEVGDWACSSCGGRLSQNSK